MSWYAAVGALAKQMAGGSQDAPAGDEDLNLLFGSAALGNTPAFGSSSAFLKPSGMIWTPSAADKIYEAFDVSQPVEQPEDLRGREKELGRLLSGVLHRRNHGIVSGPRGSGKTSLVRVFGQHADREGVVVLYAACDSDTTFSELISDFLEQIPPSSVDADQVDLLEHRVASFGPNSTPHQATSILAQIKYSQVIIIVDEFDRITDEVMFGKIASLLKLISDSRLPVRFVLVGSGDAFSNIMSRHPSLVRHITRLSTSPLSQEAISELLDGCSERCSMTLSKESRTLLQQVACGSPYHARLFGMHAALRALERNSQEISESDVIVGLADSFEEWATLNKEDAATFRSIIEGAHGNPAIYVEVARQLASADGDRPHDLEGPHREVPGKREAILSAFGNSVEQFDSRISFRDATAPQFFLALQKFAVARKSTVRRKATSGV